MDSKTNPTTIYTLQNQTKGIKEESKQEDGEQEWTKHRTRKNLINIGSTTKVTITNLSKYQLGIM